MARMLAPGDVVNGYTIVDRLNIGANAIAYHAKGRDARSVFLKQYKSPAVTLPWYRAYVAYQGELKRRVEAGTIRNFTYRFVDFFEAKAGPLTYFQVFEFVERGNDLRNLLGTRDGLGWMPRVTLAKVLLAGIQALHHAKIVHCDLKPENIQLFEDPSISAGYRLKLIDMDFSILSDQQAPWHDGASSYVGTPGYFSPEHLRGEVPSQASDVYTCGLILHELLAEGHPYPSADDDEYRVKALHGGGKPPRLRGSLPGEAKNEEVATLLLACLDPVAARRPTAEALLQTLNGKKVALTWKCPECGHDANREGQVECTGCGYMRIPPTLILRAAPPAEGSIRMNLKTAVGRNLMRSLVGEDAKYSFEPQFHVERSTRHGGWTICHAPVATNPTYLDGRPLGREPRLLSPGSVISIGPEKSRVIVEFSGL